MCSQTLSSIWILTAQKGFWHLSTNPMCAHLPMHVSKWQPHETHKHTEEITLTKLPQTTRARPSLPTTQKLRIFFNLLVVTSAALKSIQNQRQCLIPYISDWTAGKLKSFSLLCLLWADRQLTYLSPPKTVLAPSLLRTYLQTIPSV